jgi:hypothetical protein
MAVGFEGGSSVEAKKDGGWTETIQYSLWPGGAWCVDGFKAF